MLLNSLDKNDFITFVESDDALFHYTSKETLFEKILPTKKLKFGRFTETNDPQEYRPKLTGAVGWGWSRGGADAREALNNLEELLSSTSFLSFCTNTMDESKVVSSGVLKSRMWAQYGINHTGACLVFSKQKLLESFQTQIETDFYHSNIFYQDPDEKSPPILQANQVDLSITSPKQIAYDFLINKKEWFFFTKQEDYRDESEFRILHIPDTPVSTQDSYLDVSTALKGIVLGDKCPEVYFPTASNLTRKTNIVLKHLVWNKYKYFLCDLKSYEGKS